MRNRPRDEVSTFFGYGQTFKKRRYASLFKSPLLKSLYFKMNINKINSIVLASLFSASIGILPFMVSLAYGSYSRGNSIFTYASLIDMSSVYIGILFNAFLVILILGTPIYFLFHKFNLANYFSVAIIGGCFTMFIGSFQNPWLFISFSGFIIGPMFHYLYLQLQNKHEQKI